MLAASAQVAASAAQPPVDPPSTHRKGALDQSHPELVQSVRAQEGIS